MNDIKPNTVTNLCCLVTGDRFYCCRDRAKKIWELRYHTIVKVRGVYKKMSRCRNDQGETKNFDANRMVRFLRRQLVINKQTEFNIEKYFA